MLAQTLNPFESGSSEQSLELETDLKAPKDFDFMIGHWQVKHRRLKKRLENCQDWYEFDGTSSTIKTLGGFGNLEDNLLNFPEESYRALALRSFNEMTQTWSIWWLDARFPDALDTPVTGRFTQGIGLFYANDVLHGQNIKVRFKWISSANKPRWEQAFSTDDGTTWETNWIMEFSPLESKS
ncbi:DUF1579 domain-containing protein [Marinomonas sp. PE14-40]|uniref:DUF1579 domain-containing protein n=1 Tax=Marinomonas sp. PE14-40 TaxID=3060621 RepID=UPI003F67CDE8